MVSKSFTPEVVCEFNFMLFPFDYQECYIELVQDGTDGKFIDLKEGILTFNGPVNINQYRLEVPSMVNTKGNSIKVEVKFTRLPHNRMLTTLMPTILINLVR